MCRAAIAFASVLVFAGMGASAHDGAHHAGAHHTVSIEVTGATAGPTAPGQPNGAVYLTITNVGAEADRLVSAETPVAAAVEFHNSVEENGVAAMRKEAAVEIAPGATAHFAPGGFHIMLIGLKSPLTAGETTPLTLHFEKAGAIDLEIVVGDAKAGHDHGHAH